MGLKLSRGTIGSVTHIIRRPVDIRSSYDSRPDSSIPVPNAANEELRKELIF